MALGLPEQLARAAIRRALVRAAHAAAFVCLITGIIVAVAGAIGNGRDDAWPAVAALAVMTGALALVARRPTILTTILYLVIGAATVLIVTVLVMSGDTPFPTTNNLAIAMPRVALVLVGGAGATTSMAILWAALGFALGELAVIVGASLVDVTWAPNSAAVFALAVIVAIHLVDRAGRRSHGELAGPAGAEGDLQLAGYRTRELATAADRELRATARLHDTALLHLVAISSAGSGPFDERIRTAIRNDLALIAGPDWAIDQPAASAELPRLDASLNAAEHAGLEVRVVGDTSALAHVTPERAAALDAAVAQSLVNVSRHAGVDVAEVAIGVGNGLLTIAVIDTGAGFDEAAVPADRIGLRTSIRARIEQVGGTVRLWSTPGVGTTVVLSVPTEPEA